MPTPLLFPYGPFQPLGLITVSTVGTPVSLATNIGQYYTATGKSEYAVSFNQLIFQATSGNTGAIILVVAGGSASNADSIIYQIAPGATWVLGADAQSKNRYDLNCVWVDTATNGNSVQVCGITAG